jgi:hypothetical protein
MFSEAWWYVPPMTVTKPGCDLEAIVHSAEVWAETAARNGRKAKTIFIVDVLGSS